MGRILSRNEDRGDPGLGDDEDQGPSTVQVDQPPGEHDYGPGPSGVEQVTIFDAENHFLLKRNIISLLFLGMH